MSRERQPRCIAYTRAAWRPNVWVPCARRRQRGSFFCRRHEDAVNGAVLGLWAHSLPQNGAEKSTAANARKN